MGNIRAIRNRYIGCRVKKRFTDTVYEGVVTEVLGAVQTSQGLQKGIIVHIRYSDGDEEDLDWDDFADIWVKDENMAIGSCSIGRSRRKPKRPARFDDCNEASQPDLQDSFIAAEEESDKENLPQPSFEAEFTPERPTPGKVQPARPYLEATDLNQPALSHKHGVHSLELNAAVPTSVDTVLKRQSPFDMLGVPAAKKAKVQRERVLKELEVVMPPESATGLAALNPDENDDSECKLRTYGTAGHLFRISLENFMCHSHFTMDFGPHVTFISGTNGSGKSAVLQALQFCLGVSASKTGRVAKQQGFIRTGCHETKVTVVLWNTGADAFRHSVYGDFITICRRVGVRSNSWLICGARGNVVSNEKREMLAVIDHLNIDASNPIAVMSQDASRDFLSGGSKAADVTKYELYMLATSLSKVTADLEKGEEAVHEQRACVEAQWPLKKEQRHMVQKLKASIVQLEEMETYKGELVIITHALAWKQVLVLEEEVDQAQTKVTFIEGEKAGNLQQKLDAVTAEVAELEQEDEEREAAVERYLASASELKEKADTQQAQVSRVRRDAKRAAQGVQRVKSNIANLRGEKENLAAVMRESQDVGEDDTAQYEASVAEAELKINELKAEVDVQQESERSYFGSYTDACNKEADCKQALNGAELRAETLSHQQRQAQESAQHEATRFGGGPVVALLQLVKTNIKQFHRQPIGPVGSLLRLTDSKWETAADAAIGRTLGDFLVHDMHDLRLLKDLAGRCGQLARHLTIVETNFDVPLHQMPPNRLPPQQLCSLANVLSCPGHFGSTVINRLVDYAKVEKLVLAKTRDAAEPMLRQPNVKEAYTEAGECMYQKKSTSGYVPYRPGGRNNGKIGQDMTVWLRCLDQQLLVAQEGVRIATAALIVATESKEAAKATGAGMKVALAAVRKQLVEVEEHLEKLQADKPIPPQRMDGKDNSLWERMDAFDSSILEAETELQEQQQKLKEAKDAELQAILAHTETTDEVNACRAKLEEQAALTAQRLAQIEAKQQTKHDLLTSLEQLEHYAMEWGKVLKTKQDEVDTITQQATQVCKRGDGQTALKSVCAAAEANSSEYGEIPMPVSLQGLSAARKRLEKKLSKAMVEAGGDINDLQDKLLKAERQLADLTKRLQNVITAYNLAVEGLQNRRDMLKLRKTAVELKVRNSFANSLARKGHLGTIAIREEVDDNGKTIGRLEMRVQVAGTGVARGAEGRCSDMKQLSGGERSYSTIAFTLAVGEFVGQLWRAADEFDVFLDPVARTISLAALFGFARRSPHLQMILITPQDVSAVDRAKVLVQKDDGFEVPQDFVRVVTMKPARPSQKG